jgi:hypothetical protein
MSLEKALKRDSSYAVGWDSDTVDVGTWIIRQTSPGAIVGQVNQGRRDATQLQSLSRRSRWDGSVVQISIAPSFEPIIDLKAIRESGLVDSVRVSTCSECASDTPTIAVKFVCSEDADAEGSCGSGSERGGRYRDVTEQREPHFVYMAGEYGARLCVNCESIVIIQSEYMYALELQFSALDGHISKALCAVDASLDPKKLKAATTSCLVRALKEPLFFSHDPKSAYFKDPMSAIDTDGESIFLAAREVAECRKQEMQ